MSSFIVNAVKCDRNQKRVPPPFGCLRSKSLPVTGAGGRSDDAKGGVVFDLKINQRLQVLASPAHVPCGFM
jgi:hypothetical protein